MAKKSTKEIVSVRYNNDTNEWSILDNSDNPLNGFSKGYLTNVTFRTRRVEASLRGCGTRFENIGIATGEFTKGTFIGNIVGFRNLKFNDSIPSFINADGKLLTKAKYVRLLTNRKALVKE